MLSQIKKYDIAVRTGHRFSKPNWEPVGVCLWKWVVARYQPCGMPKKETYSSMLSSQKKAKGHEKRFPTSAAYRNRHSSQYGHQQ